MATSVIFHVKGPVYSGSSKFSTRAEAYFYVGISEGSLMGKAKKFAFFDSGLSVCFLKPAF